MDENLNKFDIMSDVVLGYFFETWLVPILFAVALAFIMKKLNKIDKMGQRRENTAILTEIRVESIAHALSSAPHPIGDHFRLEYEKKKAELLEAERFKDTNGKI